MAVIENFINEEDLIAMRNRMQDIVENVNPKEHQTVFSATNQVTQYITYLTVMCAFDE